MRKTTHDLGNGFTVAISDKGDAEIFNQGHPFVFMQKESVDLLKRILNDCATPEEVAKRSSDAYMADDYGTTEWLKVTRWLMKEQGLTALAAEAVLRSKYMRWAEQGDGCNLKAFKEFWRGSKTLTTAAAIQELVDGTFNN